MQNITENDIRELLDKYVVGTITAEEKFVLSGILMDERQLSIVEKILDKEYQSDTYLLDKNPTTGKAIIEFIQNHITTKTNSFIKKSTFPLLRWAVAASVILALGTTAYLFFSNKIYKDVAKKTLVNDLPAGTEGAVLTLGDGQQVVLDNNFNGTLAQEAGAVIVQKNNQLQYNATGKQNEAVLNTMSTPRGRQYKLVLSDGTKLWLNAASSVKYPTSFATNERVVQVTGEVYFEVSHNPSKPFIVKLNDGSRLQVLGTHFNINSYGDDAAIKTTLLDGAVKILKNNKSVVLKPGQQAKVQNNNMSVQKVNVNFVMAWHNGYFSFNNTELKTVLQQLSRWYDFDVVYKSGIPQIKFTGDIGRNMKLSEVLDILKETRIKALIQNKQLIIQ